MHIYVAVYTWFDFTSLSLYSSTAFSPKTVDVDVPSWRFCCWISLVSFPSPILVVLSVLYFRIFLNDNCVTFRCQSTHLIVFIKNPVSFNMLLYLKGIKSSR